MKKYLNLVKTNNLIMLKKLLLTIICLINVLICYSQIDKITVPQYVRLPADSVQAKSLISSLKSFLQATTKPNKENQLIWKDQLTETSALLDELKGIENGNKPDQKNIYSCSLDNVVLIDSTDYILQFSYIGKSQESTVIRASFKLLAKKADGHYYFYSPLQRNTQTWKIKKTGGFEFYYRTPLNATLVNEYVKKAKEFDKKLQAPYYITKMYFCDNTQEALELLGVTYKADYNGLPHDNFSAFENNQNLTVCGYNSSDQESLDIHDCWHLRLRRAKPGANINKFIDEGCAYLYGGSWGYSWPYIFKKFKQYTRSTTDWLTAYTENKNFGESAQKHLYVAYVINALLAQKIEKDKGFTGVMEFLVSGKKQKGDEDYFKALDKIDGINRSNFNAIVGKLVVDESIK
jgi:hypothetical protein